MSIAALDHYYRRLNLTNQEFTDDERKEMALKRLKELSENPTATDVEIESLTDEQEQWVNNKLPNDPFKNSESNKSKISHEEWSTIIIEKYQKHVEKNIHQDQFIQLFHRLKNWD